MPNANEAECPIDAVLYSWSSVNLYDRLLDDYKEDSCHPNEEDRYLFIVPVFGNCTTLGPKVFEMTNADDQFLTPYDHLDGRTWYGRIHDYIMSFIISKNQPYNDFFINSVNFTDSCFHDILFQEDVFSY